MPVLFLNHFIRHLIERVWKWTSIRSWRVDFHYSHCYHVVWFAVFLTCWNYTKDFICNTIWPLLTNSQFQDTCYWDNKLEDLWIVCTYFTLLVYTVQTKEQEILIRSSRFCILLIGLQQEKSSHVYFRKHTFIEAEVVQINEYKLYLSFVYLHSR